jgi:hypothetical protein
MIEIKTVISVIAVILTFVGYVPYLRDIIRGKTKPHIYTWFLWGFVTLIAFALQLGDQAGVGSLATVASALICFVVFAFGMREGKKDITKSDTVFFIVALFAVAIWFFTKQPVVSIILILAIDLLSFIPTIRKAWKKPHEETLSTYLLNTFRHGLSILALQKYSIITWLYPVTWTLINGLFSAMLIARRYKLKRNLTG